MDYKKAVFICSLITHTLDMSQIAEIEVVFEMAKQFVPSKITSLTRDEFDEIIQLMDDTPAITGVTSRYIYETTSTLCSRKSSEEIMAFLKS